MQQSKNFLSRIASLHRIDTFNFGLKYMTRSISTSNILLLDKFISLWLYLSPLIGKFLKEHINTVCIISKRSKH
jgi:hypothetical protein